jgi:hypothetical protein
MRYAKSMIKVSEIQSENSQRYHDRDDLHVQCTLHTYANIESIFSM